MVEYKHLQHQQLQQQEEDEETLSLRDLPLDADEDQGNSDHHRRSSSPEFFEFISNLTSHEMSSAEDIIFCGKLVPFKALSLPPPPQNSDHKRHSSFRRRSESLSALQSSRSSSVMMRSSRSLDYRRLDRFSSSKTTSSESVDRNSSARSIGRGEAAVSRRAAKPRWRFLLFGVVKPPAEMELSDIKSRQYRRYSSAAMIPPPENSKKSPVSKCSSYRLLKVLSCRDSTSVPVTASFCMPPPALQHV